MVQGLLGDASDEHYPVKMLIAPHAGYIYSGPIAASAYRLLVPLKNTISRVVILGPAHRIAFRGIALSGATHFQTPLGIVALDTALLAVLEKLPYVSVIPSAHAQEHSLEVHLPFLQSILSEFQLVPLLVGDAEVDEVKQILEICCKDTDTLVIISTDLSHYQDYMHAKKLDDATSQAIITQNLQTLDSLHACGFRPLRGALEFARQHDLRVKKLDQRNSGDTAGSKDRVVGYGAYVVY